MSESGLDRLKIAVSDIDAVFGEGYAKEHSELLGMYLIYWSIGYTAACLRNGLETVADKFDEVDNLTVEVEGINTVVNAIRGISRD
jgi:hypothetical protein